MGAPGWLTRSLAEVPDGEDWLGEREREVLAGLTLAKRRQDWLLGRYAAKSAVAAWLDAPAAEVEILAAGDGAPEAWTGHERAPVAISLSHRAGRALVAIADAVTVIGCDLERVEARSAAFIHEWLAPSERALVDAATGRERGMLMANLAWTAKEAAAKTRREGLRLPVRHAVARPDLQGAGDWRALAVTWPDHPPTRGWWREEPGWVMALTAEPAPEPPRRL